jgi:hypothetical protein
MGFMSTTTAKRVLKERRRFPRENLVIPVQYAPWQFASEVPPDLWQGMTIDISLTGVALALIHRLRRGGIIEMYFLPCDPTHCIEIVGHVVRSHPMPPQDTVGSESKQSHYFAGIEFNRLLVKKELELLLQKCKSPSPDGV